MKTAKSEGISPSSALLVTKLGCPSITHSLLSPSNPFHWLGRVSSGRAAGGDEKRKDFSLFRIASHQNWVPVYHPLTFLATTSPFIAQDVLFVGCFGGGGGRNNE